MKQRKNGFPAVKIDTDLFEKESTKVIINKYGSDGITTLIFAILAIFRNEGYYLYFDDDFVDYTSNQTGISAHIVENVIGMAVDIGLFDSDVFEKISVLTNEDLQRQYVACFYKRRYPMPIEKSVWLIGYDFKKDYTTKDTLIMGEEKVRVPYVKIAKAWNEISRNSEIPRVYDPSTWSEQRKKKVATLVRRHGVDEVLQAIERVGQSNFLNGKNDRGWTCTFSWFLKLKNFEKVAEGNYDNREAPKPERFSGIYDLSEYL